VDDTVTDGNRFDLGVNFSQPHEQILYSVLLGAEFGAGTASFLELRAVSIFNRKLRS
jgi:hypothetical protein